MQPNILLVICDADTPACDYAPGKVCVPGPACYYIHCFLLARWEDADADAALEPPSAILLVHHLDYRY